MKRKRLESVPRNVPSFRTKDGAVSSACFSADMMGAEFRVYESGGLWYVTGDRYFEEMEQLKPEVRRVLSVTME